MLGKYLLDGFIIMLKFIKYIEIKSSLKEWNAKIVLYHKTKYFKWLVKILFSLILVYKKQKK